MQFKFSLIKKVPIVEMAGKTCLLYTGFPGETMPVCAGVQEFFGIPGLHVAGVKALKRYTKFDYRNSEITTSDERDSGWVVKMDVRGICGRRYIDTGAAFSYVHYLPPELPSAGIVKDCGFSGTTWPVHVRRTPCEFMDHRFEIICGDAKDNPAFVPAEGVIGYDFFANFTVVVDRLGGSMTFVKN